MVPGERVPGDEDLQQHPHVRRGTASAQGPAGVVGFPPSTPDLSQDLVPQCLVPWHQNLTCINVYIFVHILGYQRRPNDMVIPMFMRRITNICVQKYSQINGPVRWLSR